MVFCSKCGAQVPDDAGFCPKCGANMGGTIPPTGFDRRHMRRQMRMEMRHGFWGWRWTPEYMLIEAISAGLIIVLLGGLLFLAASGYASLVNWSNFWAYLLIGLGAFMLLRAILSMIFMPKYGFYRIGGIIGGIILVAIGAAWLSVTLFGWDRPLWPLIIVAGGIIVIATGIARYMAGQRWEEPKEK